MTKEEIKKALDKISQSAIRGEDADAHGGQDDLFEAFITAVCYQKYKSIADAALHAKYVLEVLNIDFGRWVE
jgi:hypothetical protein